MKRRLLVLSLLLLATTAMPAMAQFTQDPHDHGAADTIQLVFSQVPDFTTNQVHLRADLWVFMDADTLTGCSMGFTWDNPNLQMDSARATPFVNGGFDFGRYLYENSSIAVTNANQRFLFAGVSNDSIGLRPTPERQLWASYYFTVSSWDSCDSIVIDTLTYSGGSDYRFVAYGNFSYKAYFDGPSRTRDTSCALPSNLVLSTDSLHFEATAGSSAPSPQTFDIMTDNDPLSFSLVESASWFSLSPIFGSTPQTVTVFVNITGLAAGEYLDSIQVNSGTAANSPQWVKIALSLAEPPPVISVSPSQFYFNAIAGGANPDPKILTIKNTGGSTLNWGATNSQSWLTLTPGYGADSTDVTLSVDITGLAYATYYDTVVVSDPSATNSPQRIPVTLSVGSDLPILVVDSQFNFVAVPATNRDIPPRTIVIRNGGAGTMNFYTQEHSTRLFSVTPTSGAAPESVVVGFKVLTGSDGDDFFDTLWVNSDEAINSPIPVVFQFHIVNNPARMYVSTDSAFFTMYECEMGANAINPSTTFYVQNIGGDDPMPFQITGQSDLFSVRSLSSIAPSVITLNSNYINLPLGVYYDTLMFYAQTSTVQYDTVYIKYEVVPGTQQPKIWVSNASYVLPAQEGSGPIPNAAMGIRNVYGGCMPWYVVENIPWMYPPDTSGINPAAFIMGINTAGYTVGEYVDSFFVYAPTASNSPGKVRMRLQMWRFHGDNDWSGEINISDLTYLVRYIFQDGPEPKPEYIVGDLTCNHRIDVADLTYLVKYLFEEGPIPCGNPY